MARARPVPAFLTPPSALDIGIFMNHKKGFTLIEILVVISIIALLAVLTIPAIRAMQVGNARAQAYNIINSALQAARSYAIMNTVNTAARFQPNGKIYLVYRVDQPFQVEKWGDTASGHSFPDQKTTQSEMNYVYLPVIDMEPLVLPRGYGVFNLEVYDNFSEPFYVCYNPSGTLVVHDNITVALAAVSAGVPRPANPDFDSDNICAFDNSTFSGTYGTAAAIQSFITEIEKSSKVNDVSHRRLARFYLVAGSDNEKEAILSLTSPDTDYGPDHYTGRWGVNRESTTALGLFETPENWDQMPVFTLANLSDTGSRQGFVGHTSEGVYAKQKFNAIYINPYTGRVIKPLQ
jgi:prepilin-type N-terminal cleavage/methylation domain-containing protein